MANNYYTYTDTFTPGLKARSSDIDREYLALQSAFDLLPTNTSALPTGTATFAGTTTGAGNLYIATMPNTRTSNSNGDQVVWIADKTNTGAVTFQVDAIGAVALRDWDGSALVGGEIVDGQFYVSRFDAANGYFILEASTDAALNKTYAEEWANAATNTLVSAAAGGNQVDDYSARHQADAAQDWAIRAEDDLIPTEFGGNGVDEYSAYHWAQKAAGVSGLPVTSTDGATLRSNGTGWDEFTDVLFGTSGSVFLQEKAAAETSVGGLGQLWIRNDSPNVLVYTDDTGVDAVLGEVTLETPVNIIGDTDGGSGNTGTALLQFTDLDESDVLADIGFTASDNFTIENLNLGGDLLIRNNNHTLIEALGSGRLHIDAPGNTGSVHIRPRSGLDDGIRVNSSTDGGNVVLYHLDLQVANTSTAANGGFFVNNLYTGGTTERVLTNSDANKGFPGSFWEYRNTTGTPPARGTFNGDSATTSLITNFYVDEEISGFGVGDQIIARMKSGDVLTIHRADSLNTHTHYKITADPTDNTDYWTVPVSYIGGSSLTNAERYRLWHHPISQGAVSGVFTTPLVIRGDTDGAPTNNGTGLIQFYDSDESDELARIGFTASDDFTIESFQTAGNFRIQVGSTNIFENQANNRTIIRSGTGANEDVFIMPEHGLRDGIQVLGATNGGGVILFHDDVAVASTRTGATGGLAILNQFTGGTTERVLTTSDVEKGWPGSYWEYRSTTGTPPARATFNGNSATTSLITEFYIDEEVDDFGVGDQIIARMKAGDVLTIHRLDALNNHTHFKITANPTDNTDYWTVPVEFIGGSSLTNTESYRLFHFPVSQGIATPGDNITGGGTTVTASATEVTVSGMDHTDDGLVLQDGARITFEDQAFANDVYMRNEGLGGGSGTLSIRGDSSFNLEVYGGLEINNGTSGPLLTALNTPSRLNVDDSFRAQGSIYMLEQSTADTNVAGDAQLWVRNGTPNELWFTDDTDTDYPVATAVMRRVSTNNSYNMNTSGNEAYNAVTYHDDGANDTITLEDSTSTTTFPVDATFTIVAPGSGTITVTEGSGTTLYLDDGTDTAGGCTVSGGVATVFRASTTDYVITGSGITA